MPPALLELLPHLLDRFRAARVRQRRRRGGLAEAGDVAGHLALELVHRVNDKLRSTDVSDAPAGHREAFRVTVERQRSLDERRMQCREADELIAVVHELLVDLVAEDD